MEFYQGVVLGDSHPFEFRELMTGGDVPVERPRILDPTRDLNLHSSTMPRF